MPHVLHLREDSEEGRFHRGNRQQLVPDPGVTAKSPTRPQKIEKTSKQGQPAGKKSRRAGLRASSRDPPRSGLGLRAGSLVPRQMELATARIALRRPLGPEGGGMLAAQRGNGSQLPLPELGSLRRR